MGELFGVLSRAIEGAPAVALSAAFVWGVLSVVLSPCHLAEHAAYHRLHRPPGRCGDEEGVRPLRRVCACDTSLDSRNRRRHGCAGRVLGDAGPYVKYAIAVVFIS